MNRKLSKRLTLVMSLVMFLIGAMLGFVAMWQFLGYKPQNISAPLKYVFYTASALLMGLLLFFSTKPVLYLMYTIGDALKKAFGRTKPLDIAGMFLGVAIGLMVTYLVDALLGLFLKIIAARIAIDIIVGLAASLLAILLCAKFLSSPEEELDAPIFGGYLLSSSALKNIKIISICSRWLSGEIYVLSVTIDNLIATIPENGGDALQNYHELAKANLLKTINVTGEDEVTQIISVAERKGLKIIAENSEEFDLLASAVTVLALDTL